MGDDQGEKEKRTKKFHILKNQISWWRGKIPGLRPLLSALTY